MEFKNRIIKYISDGLTQKQICYELFKLEIKPYSLSSVEKYLKALREEYGAKTMFHLAVILHNNNNNNKDFDCKDNEK